MRPAYAHREGGSIHSYEKPMRSKTGTDAIIRKLESKSYRLTIEVEINPYICDIEKAVESCTRAAMGIPGIQWWNIADRLAVSQTEEIDIDVRDL